MQIKTSTIYKFFLLPVLFFLSHQPAFADLSSQFGAGYGRQFRGNTDIEQYELFLRERLPYTKAIGGTNITTSMEFGLAFIRDSSTTDVNTARFSIMPQAIFSPFKNFSFIAGIGPGVMVGETKISRHDLGGPLFFSSKVGVKYTMNENWGLEYTYYHQSNGGIYEHNESLNMNQLAIVYSF